ncbi:uncharacterized [Tachysurus ichikawai]
MWAEGTLENQAEPFERLHSPRGRALIYGDCHGVVLGTQRPNPSIEQVCAHVHKLSERRQMLHFPLGTNLKKQIVFITARMRWFVEVLIGSALACRTFWAVPTRPDDFL